MSLLPFGSPPTSQATYSNSGKVKQTVYNVKDYGAKGDGSTDDTTAIANTITTASNAGGGTVFLPPGTYKTTAPLVPVSKVKIQGAGSGMTTIAGYGQQFSIMVNQASVASPTTDIEICDLKIDGSNVTNPSSYSASWKGIYLQHCTRLKIHGVYVYNTLATGIGVDYLVDSIIDRCVVDTAGNSFASLGGVVGSNGIGIGTGAYAVESWVISNCIAKNCGNCGIMCEQQNDVGAVKAQYMQFNNCSSYNNNIGYLDSGVSRVSFNSCWAWSNGRNGFAADPGDIGSSLVYSPQDVSWIGCYAFNNGTVAGSDGFYYQDNQTSIQQNLAYNLRFIQCVSAYNTSNGFQVKDASKVSFVSCYSYKNSVHGLLCYSDNVLYPVNNLQIMGGSYFDNSQTSPNANDGIRIGSSGTGVMNSAIVSGVINYDDQKRIVTDGAMTASSNVLTSNTASFTTDDVGSTVVINGAGGSGSNLTTTISTYTSATSVKTVSNASTTVSGATVTIGAQTQRYGISIAGTTNNSNIAVFGNNLIGNRNAAFNTGTGITGLLLRNNTGISETTAVSSNYSVTATDDTILATGTITVTLEDATTCANRIHTVKNVGSGTVTVGTTSSQNIDGATTYSLSSQYQSIVVKSNGTQWYVL